MPLLLLAVPVVSTLLGGLLAVHLRRYVSFLFAAGAGLLLGAAFLDLLPEAIDLGRAAGLRSASVLGLTLLAFLLFFSIDEALHGWEHSRLHGRFGAALLISHSFRDGLAIGAAYAASHVVGYAVALGIAAHDFGDGMNTVLLTTKGRSPTRADYGFLLADAAAPFLGGLLTVWWTLSPRASVVLLVLAAGFFLQMATGDFLPQLRGAAGRSRVRLLPVLFLGSALIYCANRLLAARGMAP